MTTTSSLINVLMDAMATHLATEMMTNITDDTKAGLVRTGKLQDDPTVTQINILIHPGGDDWPHILHTGEGSVYAPVFEIGGTQTWRRRFLVELKLYYDGEVVRDNARIKSNVILSRVVRELLDMPLPSSSDDFGESAFLTKVHEAYISEAGGEGTFIWRGQVKVEVFTTLD